MANSYFLALLSCLLLTNISQAQTYKIQTLDGTNANIKLRYKPFSTSFTISYLTYKLIIPSYWSAGEVKVLNKKFLEIVYYERGGSGVGTGNTLLLCISHGKLRQAMHIGSYSYSLGDEKITANYTRLLLDAANTIHAVVYDTVELKQGPRPKSISIKKSTITFNTTQQVFCNYQKNINTSLSSYNYQTNHINKRHFTGIAPAFQLDGCEYIFINGKWYGKGGDNKTYFLID